jgi:hypothetical protein
MDYLWEVLMLAMRWVHIVAVSLIVGGTLFYELVVPRAIEDLPQEQQLYVFARARWAFRWVIYWSAAAIIVSGAVSLYGMFPSYTSLYPRTFWPALIHVAAGLAALGIAVHLVVGGHPPRSPVAWMRISLVILLVTILAANLTRHVRFSARERSLFERPQPVLPTTHPHP